MRIPNCFLLWMMLLLVCGQTRAQNVIKPPSETLSIQGSLTVTNPGSGTYTSIVSHLAGKADLLHSSRHAAGGADALLTNSITRGNIGANSIAESNIVAGAINNVSIGASADIAKSKIASSGTWAAGEIPSLDAGKITTGVFGTGRLGEGTASAAKILVNGIWTNRLEGTMLINSGATMGLSIASSLSDEGTVEISNSATDYSGTWLYGSVANTSGGDFSFLSLNNGGGEVFNVRGDGLLTTAGDIAISKLTSSGATATLTVKSEGNDAILILDSDDAGANDNSEIHFKDEGVLKWVIQGDNNGAEGNGNLAFRRYDNSGVIVDTPMLLNRTDASVTFTGTIKSAITDTISYNDSEPYEYNYGTIANGGTLTVLATNFIGRAVFSGATFTIALPTATSSGKSRVINFTNSSGGVQIGTVPSIGRPELQAVVTTFTNAANAFGSITISQSGGVWKHLRVESSGTTATDSDAIHDNIGGEIAAVTAKATPTVSDFLLIEDAAASNAKKSATIGSLETALEGVLDLQDMQGAVTDGQVPNTITIDLASSATILATGRTVGMTGDVVWTSGSFNGSVNVTGTATIQADSVALTTDTTGNYAAGDAEAGAALSGDSATSFFSTGTLEDARLSSNVALENIDNTFTGAQLLRGSASTDAKLTTDISGDVTARWALFTSGAQEWGPGSGDRDWRFERIDGFQYKINGSSTPTSDIHAFDFYNGANQSGSIWFRNSGADTGEIELFGTSQTGLSTPDIYVHLNDTTSAYNFTLSGGTDSDGIVMGFTNFVFSTIANVASSTNTGNWFFGSGMTHTNQANIRWNAAGNTNAFQILLPEDGIFYATGDNGSVWLKLEEAGWELGDSSASGHKISYTRASDQMMFESDDLFLFQSPDAVDGKIQLFSDSDQKFQILWNAGGASDEVEFSTPEDGSIKLSADNGSAIVLLDEANGITLTAPAITGAPNTILAVSSAGKVSSLPLVSTMPLPIAAWRDSTVAPDTIELWSGSGTNKTDIRNFSGSAKQVLTITITIPEEAVDADSGTSGFQMKFMVKAVVTQSTEPASGEGAVWSLNGAKASSGDTLAVGGGTAVITSIADLDAHAQGDVVFWPWAEFTIASAVPGDTVVLNFARESVAEAADDYVQKLGAAEVLLKFKYNAATY